MISLSSIIKTFEAEFLARYGNALLPGQRQALAAMKQCRTALSPRLQAQCSACDAQRFIPHSCGHRACPHCQHHESQQWLQRQINQLVPGADFLHLLLRHVLPKGLRRARNFGFLHPNSKRLIQLLHLLFRINPGRAAAAIRPRPALACLDCGGAMRIVRTRIMPTPPGSDRPTDVTAGAVPM